jgi:hypothetical protein
MDLQLVAVISGLAHHRHTVARAVFFRPGRFRWRPQSNTAGRVAGYVSLIRECL